MIYINIAHFVLICLLEKDYSMIETRGLKNVVFIQTICFEVLVILTLICYSVWDTKLSPHNQNEAVSERCIIVCEVVAIKIYLFCTVKFSTVNLATNFQSHGFSRKIFV